MDLLSKIICYENTDFYVMWKPNTLPTTFGKEGCFLDILLGKNTDPKTDFSLPKFLIPYIDLPDFDSCLLKQSAIQQQLAIF